MFSFFSKIIDYFYVCFPDSSLKSTVTSSSHPDMTFTLSLIRSEQTFDQPEQSWEFVADMAVSLDTGDLT